jgi:hypothetical protein
MRVPEGQRGKQAQIAGMESRGSGDRENVEPGPGFSAQGGGMVRVMVDSAAGSGKRSAVFLCLCWRGGRTYQAITGSDGGRSNLVGFRFS